MTKKDNTISWIIGIIILIVVLNYFGIIDLSQIFSIAEESVPSVDSVGVGDIKHYVP